MMEDCRSQTNSRAANDAATYSASVVETATHRCFLLDQETKHPFTKKQLPLVDRMDKCELAQSASVYPIRSREVEEDKEVSSLRR